MKNKLLIASTIVLLGAGMSLSSCTSCSQTGGNTPTPPPAEPTLVDISIATNKKTEYEVGDEFVKPVITASYSDETTKTVTDECTFSGYNMAVADTYDVTVTYLTKSKSYQIVVKEKSVDPAALQNAKNEAIEAVSEAFDVLDLDEYTTSRRTKIIEMLNNTLKAIREATTIEAVEELETTCIEYFNNAPRAKDITKGTWFDVKSAESTYELDRDEENRLVITYDGRPGNWVYLGTRSLETDLNENNYAKVVFSNDIDDQIEACVQFTGNNNYKVDSHVFTVAGHETKTVRLDYYQEITNFYFFLDSISDHTRKGQVTILETSLGYEERPQEEIPYSKTVQIDKPMSKDDSGAETGYTLTEDDKPLYISRVDALVQVNYHGNGDSKKWFGLHVYAGSDHISVKESEAHAQDATIDGVKNAGSNFYINMPINKSKKLVAGDNIHMDISYQADGLTFQVISYTFFYSYWKAETTETVDVNTQIYIDGAGKDGDGNYYAATIPYSSFTKTGKVLGMDVYFTTLNNQSYGKSQIYFTGFEFTKFESGNNNVLNVGSKMDTTKAGNPVSDHMTLYPISDINLTSGGSITIVCWWASATSITIDSLVMHTENLAKPEAVSGLEAHPIDSGVVLTWASSEFANAYEVYQDDIKIKEVSSTYVTVDGLTNGTKYTFKVVAKNASGSSEPAVVEGTPMEGATYDTFIEGLNTALEEKIGDEKMQTLFNNSSCYASLANNYRFKKVIDKMKNGEETTIAFMGGSITVGETAKLRDENNHAKGYAYYTYQWLKRNYDEQNKSKFQNGSISGTGSEIGIVRAQKDILDHNPDLIFIEFAGNNGSTLFYQQSYESLLRKCMALPNDPAIVLVFCATSYTGSAETYMKDIGEYYGFPMFSMDKGMKSICTILDKDRTDPIFHDYSDDATHPTDQGHQLMSKALCYFLRNQISRATDSKNTYQSSPSKVGNDKFDNLVSVDNTNSSTTLKSLGSFVAANTSTPSTRDQSDVTAFQQGWKKTDTTVNQPMEIEVNAKNFILIYEAGNSAIAGDPTGNIVVTYTNKNDPSDTGSLTWDVSKTVHQSTSGSTAITPDTGNGWGNPVGILIFDKTTSAVYTISIKMSDNSGICTIMAYGYTA